MITRLKNAVKRVPPFRRLIDGRDALEREANTLRREVARLTTNLADKQSWGTPCYCQDGMINYGKNMAFARNERFVAAYQAALGTVRDLPHLKPQIEWRIHMSLWAAQQALHLNGDFVECGVFTGFTSLAVCTFLDFNRLDKSLYLFDTFHGIPADQVGAKEAALAQDHNERLYAQDTYEIVKRSFAGFPRVKLVRGKVPDTLHEVNIERVSYLHIDMNVVVPEIAALEHFWSRLVPGAAVILDDYGWEAHQEQKAAMDQFASVHGVAIATLPTGQGLLLKPH